MAHSPLATVGEKVDDDDAREKRIKCRIGEKKDSWENQVPRTKETEREGGRGSRTGNFGGRF